MQLGRRADGRAHAAALIVGAESTRRPRRSPAPGSGGARARSRSRTPTAFFRHANRLAPTDVAVNTAWGELFLEKYDRKEAMQVVPGRAQGRRDARAARSSASRASPPRRTRRRRRRRSSGRSRSIPTPCRRTCSPRRCRSTTASATRRERAFSAALKVNPNSLEARSLEAAIDFLEGKTADFETTGPAGPEDQSDLRRGVSRRRRSRRAQLPLRRSRGAGRAAVWRIDDANTPGARRPRSCTCCAPATSRARAVRSSAPSRTIPSISSTYNLLTLLDTLDKFETITDGDLIFRFDPEEVGGDARARASRWPRRRWPTLSKRYSFTPTGSDPDRDVPEARRLRRAHARPARA